jgi:hypothetical protein
MVYPVCGSSVPDVAFFSLMCVSDFGQSNHSGSMRIPILILNQALGTLNVEFFVNFFRIYKFLSLPS